MDGQTFHNMRVGMHRLLEQTPTCLRGGDVTGVQVFLHLINFPFHTGTIGTFVGVLKKILHGFDGGAHFHVDVTFKFPEQPFVIWHHPPIITDTI